MTRRRAGRQGTPIDNSPAGELLAMLAMPRPHDSAAERAFTDRWLAGLEADAFGNRIALVGSPRVAWSSHIDTVDRAEAPKCVALDGADGDTIRLVGGRAGTCLGADDTVGVWIMLAMLRARRPGLYIFHRGEERGGLGSEWIATHAPQLLDATEIAIAFDRCGQRDIITHQLGGRCASAAFAAELSSALNDAGLPGYRADSTGVFTDTANYTHLVSECTNLSVGYEREHGPTEILCLSHALALRSAMLTLDTDALRAHRDPTPSIDAVDWRDFDTQWPSYDRPAYGYERDSLVSLIADYPHIAAELLRDCGLDERDMMQALADAGEL